MAHNTRAISVKLMLQNLNTTLDTKDVCHAINTLSALHMDPFKRGLEYEWSTDYIAGKHKPHFPLPAIPCRIEYDNHYKDLSLYVYNSYRQGFTTLMRYWFWEKGSFHSV